MAVFITDSFFPDGFLAIFTYVAGPAPIMICCLLAAVFAFFLAVPASLRVGIALLVYGTASKGGYCYYAAMLLLKLTPLSRSMASWLYRLLMR